MNEQDAIFRAKRIADEQGWTWIEPAIASLDNGQSAQALWRVCSNAQGMGCIVSVDLDDRTGDVVGQSYLRR